MNRFLFHLVLMTSRLPLWVLYRFSDLLYGVNYLFIGYRKKVITTNLKNSFPEKSDAEIRKIRNRFYRNLFDYIVETLKSFTISKNEMLYRVQYLNRAIFKECYDEKKDIIFLAGHVFNWEWLTGMKVFLPQKHRHPVYKKMKNAFWEDKMQVVRNRFGGQAIESKEVIRNILKTKENGESVYMFVADQTPSFHRVHYGLTFLNQKTPVFMGYDKLSTKRDLAFVYCEMKKVKRGFYQVNYHRIYPDGEKFEAYEVVNKFHAMLEETIRKRPDNWLWSHKRWKYQYALP